MFLDTQPASLGNDGGLDPWGPFRVDSLTERAALMRQLRDGSVPINLSAPDGHALTTALWSFDPAQNRVVFSASEVDPRLQRLVEADEAVAVAYLDSVKVQFDLHDLVLVRGARACALQAAMPRDLYRFQRRGAYRVRTLEQHSPTAGLRHPAMPDMTLALRVLDVSVGGCALFLPADVPAIEPGSTLAGVQIELDADTRFSAPLRIHHVTSLGNSDRGVRLGCEWAQLDGQAARALQRYIDQTQKRRRLLSLG